MASDGEIRLQKGYGCYFYAQFARDSFCGHLDPAFEAANGFDESQIVDFIRASRPRLFRELKNLPLYSTDIADSRLVSGKNSQEPSAGRQQPAVACTQTLDPLISTVRHPGGGLSTVWHLDWDETRHMLELQHKRYLQARVLNGYNLTLRKLIVASLLIPCSDPQCVKDTTVIPNGAFFLTLSKDLVDTSGNILSRSVLHYSLTCLERLFDQGLSITNPCELDGYFDKNVDMPVFPYHYPSNSPEARRIRQNRHNEIEGMTQGSPVRAEGEFKLAQVQLESKTPSLKLRRPNDLPPYDRRYKKQGLMYENKRRRRVLDQTEQQQQDEVLVQKARSHQDHLICHCREPAGDSELIHCNSAACMIGTFHLQCLNLRQALEEGDEVYCSYCAENLDAEDSSDEEMEGTISSSTNAVAAGLCTAIPTSPVSEKNRDRNISEETTGVSQGTEISNSDMTARAHGFTAINSNNIGQLDGPRPPIPATPFLGPTSTCSTNSETTRTKEQVHVPFQPDSLHVSFVDLAPFISVSHLAHAPLGLTSNEARLFQKWKRTCPKSNLLHTHPSTLLSKGPTPGRVGCASRDQDHAAKENEIGVYKLSDMLSNISGDQTMGLNA